MVTQLHIQEYNLFFCLIKMSLECIVLCFFLFRVAPAAFGSSQVRGGIGTAAEEYTTATAKPDPSHIPDLCHSLQQHWILNPLSKSRGQTHMLRDIISCS